MKDNVRVEAYGAIDETNASIGLARAAIQEGSSGSREVLGYIDSTLEVVQHKLFAIGTSLAGNDDPAYGVKDSDIDFLEKCIDRMDEQVPPIKAFILPFGTDLCARLHLARTISRRAERSIISLSKTESIDPNIIAYSNRLSDFLFTLARYANKGQGMQDVSWKKDMKELEVSQQQLVFTNHKENHMAESKTDAAAQTPPSR